MKLSNNNEILQYLGSRIKQLRLRNNITQSKLAEKTGLNRVTISEIENGAPTSLTSLIEIMRALGIIDNLENLIPIPPKSPFDALKEEEKKRKRARNENN